MEARASLVLEQLRQNERLSLYVDATLPMPKPYRGTGDIKLIVLGQDPTVKNPLDRQKIRTVLNLDRNGSIRSYLATVCNDLGIRLNENVYATNLYKNFFVRPPTQIEDIDIFQACAGYWLPLLQDELTPFDSIPVITLGEPILAPLVGALASAKVREYWGYDPGWRGGVVNSFQYIQAADNRLHRIIFPYPHQPSLRKQFYRQRLKEYTRFVRAAAFPNAQ